MTTGPGAVRVAVLLCNAAQSATAQPVVKAVRVLAAPAHGSAEPRALTVAGWLRVDTVAAEEEGASPFGRRRVLFTLSGSESVAATSPATLAANNEATQLLDQRPHALRHTRAPLSLDSAVSLLAGSDGALLLNTRSTGGAVTQSQSPRTLKAGTWYHVALVVEETPLGAAALHSMHSQHSGEHDDASAAGAVVRAALWVDGEAWLTQQLGSPSDSFALRRAALGPFAGGVDDLALWRRALSGDEVRTLALGGARLGEGVANYMTAASLVGLQLGPIVNATASAEQESTFAHTTRRQASPVRSQSCATG